MTPITSIKIVSAFFVSMVFVAHSVSEETLPTTVTTTETITVPLANKPASDISRPKRGQSEAKVLKLFGEPIKRHPARGKPPISKWDFPQFTVVFESGYVIHTVVKTNDQ